jgi:hypothetical protein
VTAGFLLGNFVAPYKSVLSGTISTFGLQCMAAARSISGWRLITGFGKPVILTETNNKSENRMALSAGAVRLVRCDHSETAAELVVGCLWGRVGRSAM